MTKPMVVRAKFVCTSKLIVAGCPSVEYKFTAVSNDGTPENERFHRYTPSGEMKILVDNPAVDGFFMPGARYYLDITPVDAGE